ncbi:MAG: cob(I)yrinic acid a,c-diamide adenosyltransferase, partial [Armatimonadetes bacterium]|nr:cob(I)yrinic acid a,c-diamide adenosyltransferase [Armatimonadota bacterium]
MKLYTKTGDAGQTSLFGGKRVDKDELRVEAYGTVDELNAVLGVAAAHLRELPLEQEIHAIQSDLFDLGADLATPPDASPAASGWTKRIQPEQIHRLEEWIDRFQAETEPLAHFVLPGGSPGGAALHLARTVCRRAERRVVSLAKAEAVTPEAIIYLNRLSDL